MKKFVLFAVLGLTTLFATQVVAQSKMVSFSYSGTATGLATANIVVPIEIHKDVDLAFGNIASGPSAGTVTVAIDDHRSGDGGITLISAGNVNHAASFTVIGYPEATFSISLPSSILLESNGNEMVVDQFVSDLGLSSVLGLDGISELKIGATLNVEPNQAPGLYNGTFDVVVAYN